jgi:tRNA modification GTPase
LCPGKPLPKPRYASVRTLYDSTIPLAADSALDSSALLLFLPAPHTTTGEDVLELHVHGGTAVVKAVLQAIARCHVNQSRVRHAEPGEFTRRAFLNSRLDLTQVEALGDVLSAETEQQRKLSMRGTANDLAKQYETWRTRLLFARGELEALIDFSEDQHFDESPAMLASSVASQVRVLKDHIEAHVNNAMRGELLRNGISVALLGAPNAGKSSLLNRIVGREASIVSQDAGTTRDIVEVGIDLGGYLCRFGDMAGLRSEYATANVKAKFNSIEKEGIKRARQRALESDVVVVVAQVEKAADGHVRLLLDAEVVETATQCATQGSRMLAAINKIDIAGASQEQKEEASLVEALCAQLPVVQADMVFLTSCTSPEHLGILAFTTGLTTTFECMTNPVSAEGEGDGLRWQYPLGASERHRLLLQDCLDHLSTFLHQLTTSEVAQKDDSDIVVAAEALRAAADCLAKITGRGDVGDVEEVLGVVFEKFCIGK